MIDDAEEESVAAILELELELTFEDVAAGASELLEEELLATELDTDRLEGVILDATEELMATDETAVGLDLLLPPPPPPPPHPTNPKDTLKISPVRLEDNAFINIP